MPAATRNYGSDESLQGTLERLKFVAWLSDSSIRIPGTSRTVGFDALFSIIPGIGTFVGTAISMYLILESVRHKVPLPILARMAGNTFLDTVIGSIPVIGFLFDAVFKANQRNVTLLLDYFERR